MTAPDPHITISTAWHLTTDIEQLLIGTALHYSQENEIQWFSDLKGGSILDQGILPCRSGIQEIVQSRCQWRGIGGNSHPADPRFLPGITDLNPSFPVDEDVGTQSKGWKGNTENIGQAIFRDFLALLNICYCPWMSSRDRKEMLQGERGGWYSSGLNEEGCFHGSCNKHQRLRMAPKVGILNCHSHS